MRSQPLLTLAVMIACVVVFAALNLFDREAVLLPLLISEFIQPTLPEVRAGQLWRLFTPALLHFGIFHIVFNLMWVWELGRAIEFRQGALRLLVVIACAALSSNLAQYFISGPVFGGMSGVVYGLFGYVWIQGRCNRRFGGRLNPPIVNLMLGWFVLCWSGLLEVFFNLSVANTAHTMGLAVGIAASGLVCLLQRLHIRA